MGKKRTWPWTRPDPRGAERAQLDRELARTRTGIAQAYAGFNATADGDLTEFYIYEIQALRARYSYLLRQRKALEGGGTAAQPQGLPQPAPQTAARVVPLRPARPVA